MAFRQSRSCYGSYADDGSDIEVMLHVGSDYDLIYAVYNETTQCLGPHEDAHIFSYQIAIPDSFFLREGFAMYFDQCYHGRDNAEIAKEWFQSNKSFSITALIDNRAFWQLPEEIAYPLAGVFAQWIIQHDGMPTYLEIYCNGGHLNDCLSLTSFAFDSMFAESMLANHRPSVHDI